MNACVCQYMKMFKRAMRRVMIFLSTFLFFGGVIMRNFRGFMRLGGSYANL